jgi:hypothetical protein
MKKTKITASLFIFAAILSGCASNPKKISGSYVSPLKYKNYDCDQIAMEMDYVSQRTAELYNSLKKEASADSVQMGVGLVLFWPALFMLEGGDGPEAAEYARLKGEYEALRKSAVEKKCDLSLLPPSPDELIKEKEEAAKEERSSGRSRR